MAAGSEPQANKKFFGAAVFQKCCRGVGEQPTFAKQIQFCNLFFLLQLHFLKLANSQFDCLCEISYKFGQGNGAIAARWQVLKKKPCKCNNHQIFDNTKITAQ
ncbi:MAG: hypothetical protein MSS55_09005 [Ruminococcus sp.]|nr:hypothetical protein [Ruminococcus sp.]